MLHIVSANETILPQLSLSAVLSAPPCVACARLDALHAWGGRVS